ncbi:MAG TPA: pyrroline-5-carboxylate reductase, partial [Thermodesulfobacteriota bacterium]|nr:pyrroline-5-carboxylate reductase [Thermodesulfobacteriota bacterium]
MIDKKLCFIGGGNMAEAMIRGILETGTASAETVLVAEPRPARRQYLADTFRLVTMEDNLATVRKSDVIILAVKPQMIAQVLQEISPAITPEMIVLSIAAGIPTSVIESFLRRDVCVIRAMPNTPAQIGCGATALCGGSTADPDALVLAQSLFGAIGTTVIVQESQMDAVTGLSGSGPAYIFLVIEALTDGGVAMGLPRDVAQALVVQTLVGAGRMVQESGKHPGQLKDMVTSPGGTTIRGLQVLEKRSVRAALI